MEKTSFLALTQIHDQLEELFLCYQEALLDFAMDEATTLLTRYQEGLALHMRHEEGWLMPLFRRIGEIRRWPAKLYLGEHEKMRAFFPRFEPKMAHLRAAEGQGDKRTLITLLELQTTFKHLCEHHDQREKEGFFPVLDRVTTDEEKTYWLERCFSEWQSWVDQHKKG